MECEQVGPLQHATRFLPKLARWGLGLGWVKSFFHRRASLLCCLNTSTRVFFFLLSLHQIFQAMSVSENQDAGMVLVIHTQQRTSVKKPTCGVHLHHAAVQIFVDTGVVYTGRRRLPVPDGSTMRCGLMPLSTQSASHTRRMPLGGAVMLFTNEMSCAPTQHAVSENMVKFQGQQT